MEGEERLCDTERNLDDGLKMKKKWKEERGKGSSFSTPAFTLNKVIAGSDRN